MQILSGMYIDKRLRFNFKVAYRMGDATSPVYSTYQDRIRFLDSLDQLFKQCVSYRYVPRVD